MKNKPTINSLLPLASVVAVLLSCTSRLPLGPKTPLNVSGAQNAAASGISGRAIDTNGNPVAGATMSVVGMNCAATTGSNGRYNLACNPPQPMTLKGSAVGYVSGQTGQFYGSSAPDLILQSNSIVTLRGKVVRASDNLGVANATLFVNDQRLLSSTDSSGNFTVSGASFSAINLHALASGFLEAIVQITLVPGTVEYNTLTIALTGGTTLSGYVRDQSTGAAIPAAEVWYDPLGLKAVTLSNGYYLLPGVPVGTRQIRATAPGYQTNTMTVANLASGTNSLEILLASTTGIFTGTIVDQTGAPLMGATLSLMGTSYQVTTNGSGWFMLPAVPNGTYSIYVVKNYGSYSSSDVYSGISIAPGATTTHNFVFTAASSLAGTVKAATYPSSGSPLPAIITLNGATLHLTQTADAQGNYNFGTIITETCVIKFHLPGYYDQTYNLVYGTSPQNYVIDEYLTVIPVSILLQWVQQSCSPPILACWLQNPPAEIPGYPSGCMLGVNCAIQSQNIVINGTLYPFPGYGGTTNLTFPPATALNLDYRRDCQGNQTFGGWGPGVSVTLTEGVACNKTDLKWAVTNTVNPN